MGIVTYPLNNIEYSAEDAELFHVTRTSGVYAKNSFDYSVTGADNTIVINTGIGWIKNSEFSGKVIALKKAISLDMGLPDSVYPRIDSIVIQFDANKNETNIIAKQGTAASYPIAPSVIQTESVYELHLYHVHRKAGSIYITTDDITDLRLNNSYCGLMADSVTNIDKTIINTATTITDCDEAILNGWYYNAGGAANGPGLFSQSAFTMLVTGYGTGYCVTQVAFSGGGHSAYPYLAVRKKVDDSWDEWEYLNAPIIVGTEYRTTQRYLGKPVYVMGVDCGALPNNTTKTITWNASGGVTPIDYAVVTSLGRVIIGTGYDDSVSQAHPVVAMVSQYNIRLKTTIDFSANSATAWIKYIKN